MNFTRTFTFATPVAAAFVLSIFATPTTAQAADPTSYLRQLDHFDRYSTQDEKYIEDNYEVEDIFNIDTDGKSKLSPYYWNQPSKYGSYTEDGEFIYDPYWLLRLDRTHPDGRRYPADGPVLRSCNCGRSMDLAPSVAPIVEDNADEGVLYHYVNNSMIHRNAYNRSNNKFGDSRSFTTFYSNFRNHLGQTTRW